MKRGSSRRLTLAPSSLAVAIAAPLLPRHLLGGVLDGFDDIVIARAPAEIALELVPDLLLGRLRIALDHLRGGHDHARRAEAALQAMLFPEAVLDRMELAVRGHALDGLDLRALRLHGEHGAGLHRLAVEVDGTGAALARVAAHVRAGEAGQLADEVNEEQSWLDLVGMLDAVDGDAHGRFHRAYLLGSLDADR